MSKIDEQIADIDLPIEYPQQLYLRKDGVFVDAYDPVYEIAIGTEGILITGHSETKYAHKFEEFDQIYVTNSEEQA